MSLPKELEVLQNFFVKQPNPLLGVETIQVLLFREILDFTVLRTEDTRELNTVITPLSTENDENVQRVAFLGSKQKAVESRQMERLLRTAANEADYPIEECYLKDYLCLECPRCALYGGTNASASKTTNANIKHRVAYSTAFSLAAFEQIQQTTTFNGISDLTVQTGQTLNERISVKPATIFPSIVTLHSVTWKELILMMKIILSSHKYGAESRIGGDVRNTVVGITGGWEEFITPLEFTMELNSEKEKSLSAENVTKILNKYKLLLANQKKSVILSPEQVDDMLKFISGFEIDKKFLTKAYEDVRAYRDVQENSKAKKK
ncbi:type I-D CRISPR-associated protein Cas7/Csc2 [Phosphitispora sp. TUW77]|uniref:type I-D CRISPR-associated protein Cas7/Csc2 n=1 Tax=Phosphitispora sp. TUW77 TaxID=3152361 RepID=UPI003AB3FA6A